MSRFACLLLLISAISLSSSSTSVMVTLALPRLVGRFAAWLALWARRWEGNSWSAALSALITLADGTTTRLGRFNGASSPSEYTCGTIWGVLALQIKYSFWTRWPSVAVKTLQFYGYRRIIRNFTTESRGSRPGSGLQISWAGLWALSSPT